MLVIIAEIAAQLTGDSQAVGASGSLALAMILGTLPALCATFVGTMVMSLLSNRFEAARSPLAWLVAGCSGGAAAGWCFGGFEGGSASFGIAFVITSTICAGICRFPISCD
jgi:hypothetical protein